MKEYFVPNNVQKGCLVRIVEYFEYLTLKCSNVQHIHIGNLIS